MIAQHISGWKCAVWSSAVYALLKIAQNKWPVFAAGAQEVNVFNAQLVCRLSVTFASASWASLFGRHPRCCDVFPETSTCSLQAPGMCPSLCLPPPPSPPPPAPPKLDPPSAITWARPKGKPRVMLDSGFSFLPVISLHPLLVCCHSRVACPL